jgi:hypothetical protein
VKFAPFRVGVVLALAVSASAVYAEEAKDAPPPAPAATPPTAAKIPLIGGNKVSIFGGVSDAPFVAVTGALNGGWIVGGGVQLNINPNGLPAAPTSKVACTLLAYGSYQFRNEFPLSYGPEVLLAVPVAPNNVGDVVQFTPGFSLFYAPWAAPIIVGGAVGARFTFVKGASMTFDTVTVGVRFAYVFS